MLRRKKKQNRKVKFAKVKCVVSENLLTEIAKQAPSPFFVHIARVCKKSALNEAIMGSEQRYVTSLTSGEEYDIVLETDIIFFEKILPLLFVGETEIVELIVIYFPLHTITFEQFLYNMNHSQRFEVMRGLCYLTCTWVTEDNELFFHFDNFQGEEMYEKCKKTVMISEGDPIHSTG